MKKKIIIITVAGLLLIVGTISIILTVLRNDNEVKTEPPNETYKYNVFGKGYNSLEEVPQEDIDAYISEATFFFKGKTYETFGDNEIALVVGMKYLIYKEATEETIQAFVENYFGIKNYELKAKTYHLSIRYNFMSFTITKNGNNYTSDIPVTGNDDIYADINIYQLTEFSKDQIILRYDYGHYAELRDQEPGDKENEDDFIIIGATDIYLKYNGENLILEKIIYTELEEEIHATIRCENEKCIIIK